MQNIFKSDKYYLTDGGLETSLVYNQGVSLNEFAAFELLLTLSGKNALKKYYSPYLKFAATKKIAFILETPTWRANSDWGRKLGYSNDELIAVNINAVGFMCEIVKEQTQKSEILISGSIGPRGDGYVVENNMTVKEAYNYHHNQIKAFEMVDADLITALTLNYVEEAIGIVLGAKKNNLPVVISFTVELDGKLPSGQCLKDALIEVDTKTNNYPCHYMINCAHPNHFMDVLSPHDDWINRIKGIRANSSTKSHQELDRATELDPGNKYDLALKYKELHQILPNLNVLGGCCGTDIGHIKAICDILIK
ncbi:homocysteine S-methyltransferase family protein [Kriegella aquimaris]|uniref:Homocysteine S-methyltransferase n=1 Tax=Kriegella aquimaris TaxID=192904 RepID=A0A1G9S8G1_9FLAO|nr:homocysteine S-methyltransferase family protein [Kriegella aquimaris]SDM31758.1 homocysteine S-methyltransferase [Kriegella aquimaris]